jgi:putative endonuclease
LDLFNKKTENKKELGAELEKFASDELVKKGLEIVTYNYLCKMGEIDIIAKDHSDLVFIEVRYRKNNLFGGAVTSVDYKKQKRIINAAQHYLQKHKLTNKMACRFDVFAITGNLNQIEYNWIKAAFNTY